MLKFQTPDGSLEVSLRRLVVAGWTGRDAAAVQHHIEELADIGVPRPSDVPLYYEVGPELATQAEEIWVVGPETSGEVEPFVLRAEGRLWLGLASDHTDRWLEATSVAHSKQACPKVVSAELWRFDTLADALDEVILTTHIDGGLEYQSGPMSNIRPLAELVDGAQLAEREAMLCGTLTAKGGVRPAQSYDMTMAAPSGNSIKLSYRVKTLPVVS